LTETITFDYFAGNKALSIENIGQATNRVKQRQSPHGLIDEEDSTRFGANRIFPANELPRSLLRGYQKDAMRIFPKASPANVFIVVRLCSPSFDPEALDGRP